MKPYSESGEKAESDAHGIPISKFFSWNGLHPSHEGITNTYLTAIAEFKNEKWFYVGDLAQGRIQHDAVTSGPFTMIVGGNPTVSSGSS